MGLCESVEPTKDGELTIIHPTNRTWWQAGQLLIVVVHRPIPVCWALDPVCSPWLQAWPKTLAVDIKTCTGETENQPKWMFIPKKIRFREVLTHPQRMVNPLIAFPVDSQDLCTDDAHFPSFLHLMLVQYGRPSSKFVYEPIQMQLLIYASQMCSSAKVQTTFTIPT